MKRVQAACICQTLHFILKDDTEHLYAVKQVREEVEQYKKNSGSQQHHELIMVSGIDLIRTDEIHPRLLLFLGHGNALPGIVDHHIRQLEVEWIAPHDFLIDHDLVPSHDAASCGIHGVRLAMGIIGADDHHWLRKKKRLCSKIFSHSIRLS